MTQKTEDVVSELLRGVTPKLAKELPETASSRCQRGADLIQSLSDRLVAQDDLLRRARSLIRPYCAADEELRAFSDELTVCLVEGKE